MSSLNRHNGSPFQRPLKNRPNDDRNYIFLKAKQNYSNRTGWYHKKNHRELGFRDKLPNSSISNKVKYLSGIKKIDISENGLTRDYIDLFINCKNLRTIHSDHNKIRELSNVYDKFPSLYRVNYKGNYLTSLPSSFSRSSIGKLDLTGNLFMVIPNNLPPDLHKLNMVDNKIFVIPTIIGKLKKLTELNLSGNPIKRINTSFPSSLEYLNLTGCELEKIPSTITKFLTKLEILIVANSKIKSLSEFGNLRDLHTLVLSGNSRLDELPLGMDNLQSLKLLDLNSTTLVRVNKDILRMNPQTIIKYKRKEYSPRQFYNLFFNNKGKEVVVFKNNNNNNIFNKLKYITSFKNKLINSNLLNVNNLISRTKTLVVHNANMNISKTELNKAIVVVKPKIVQKTINRLGMIPVNNRKKEMNKLALALPFLNKKDMKLITKSVKKM